MKSVACCSVLAAMVLVAGACSTGGMSHATSSDEPLPPAGDDRPTVLVQNSNWSDMVVYAERDGFRRRLGMVTSMNSDRFRLPRGMDIGAGGVQLIAEPIAASGRFNTGPINIGPGQAIQLRIENQLAISNWSIR